MSSALRTVLTDFTRIEGVAGVAFVSKDGFVIESIIPGGGIEELRFGDLDIVVAEYRSNYLLLEDVEPAYFVVIAEPCSVGLGSR